MVQKERAVIVFFRDVPHLKEFKASPYYGKIKNKILVRRKDMRSCFLHNSQLLNSQCPSETSVAPKE